MSLVFLHEGEEHANPGWFGRGVLVGVIDGVREIEGVVEIVGEFEGVVEIEGVGEGVGRQATKISTVLHSEQVEVEVEEPLAPLTPTLPVEMEELYISIVAAYVVQLDARSTL